MNPELAFNEPNEGILCDRYNTNDCDWQVYSEFNRSMDQNPVQIQEFRLFWYLS